MREIERSNQFKRDYKRELKGLYGKTVADDLASVLRALVADAPLEPRYRDHPLRGSFAGYRDCHIRPDLVLVYGKPDANTLQLVRLGSHSELFE